VKSVPCGDPGETVGYRKYFFLSQVDPPRAITLPLPFPFISFKIKTPKQEGGGGILYFLLKVTEINRKTRTCCDATDRRNLQPVWLTTAVAMSEIDTGNWIHTCTRQ
jgi:hypothetical protein